MNRSQQQPQNVPVERQPQQQQRGGVFAWDPLQGADVFGLMDQMLNRFGPDFVSDPLLRTLLGGGGGFAGGSPFGGQQLLGDAQQQQDGAPATSQQQKPASQQQLQSYGGGSQQLAPFGGGGQLTFPPLGVQGIRCDIKETDRAFQLTADLPGVSRENVKIEVDPEARTLRIAAESGSTKQEDYDAGGGVRVHLSERATGTATRTLRLPPSVDVDAIGSANVNNGVLNLLLPKKASGSASRRVQVS